MKEVNLTGSQFKKIIQLGEVVTLEGYVCDQEGDETGFYFNRHNKIRPPVNVIGDDHDIILTDIMIMTGVEAMNEDGELCNVAFILPEIEAIAKIL